MSTVAVTQESFVSLVEKEGILVIDWWAAWCGPCRAFAPVFEKASARHPDVTWGKVDTEAEPEIAGAMGIRAIPTLSIFRDGILVFHNPGMLPPAALEDVLAKVRALDMDKVREDIAEQEKAREVAPEVAPQAAAATTA